MSPTTFGDELIMINIIMEQLNTQKFSNCKDTCEIFSMNFSKRIYI